MAWTAPKTWARNDPLNADNLNTFIRDNQNSLKSQVDSAANVIYRTRGVSGSNVSLATNDDVFGPPLLNLTIAKASANVLAGCQVTFRDPATSGTDFAAFELRLRCYQASPLKTVDVLMDYYISDGGVVSLAPTTLFLGFAAGAMSFSVTLTAGGPIDLLTGNHTIWAMEL